MRSHSGPGATWLSWFTGGNEHPYMTLIHCMSGDWLWIAITVLLDLAIAAGYVMIAMHWSRNQRRLPEGPAKQALRSMRNIFVFCGICGYIFIPIKMVWPAWRLYDLFAAVLAFYTWRYAWSAKDLKVLYSELGRSEKLAIDLAASREESRRKSHFLNAISHDLRTPLNGLTLQAELAALSAESSDRELLREALSEIKASAKATSDLLNRFLELARLDWAEDHNQVSDVDLEALLHEVASMHQAAADQKRLFLRVRSPRGLRLSTDPIKLERILVNLVSNAIKFTEDGGISIEVEPIAADVHIRVIDTGVGISPEHQASLFQEFFQVNNYERNRRKGFGLGLAISRRLAEQLGGSLICHSEAGHGSVFELAIFGVLGETPAGSIPPTRQHTGAEDQRAPAASGGG